MENKLHHHAIDRWFMHDICCMVLMAGETFTFRGHETGRSSRPEWEKGMHTRQPVTTDQSRIEVRTPRTL